HERRHHSRVNVRSVGFDRGAIRCAQRLPNSEPAHEQRQHFPERAFLHPKQSRSERVEADHGSARSGSMGYAVLHHVSLESIEGGEAIQPLGVKDLLKSVGQVDLAERERGRRSLYALRALGGAQTCEYGERFIPAARRGCRRNTVRARFDLRYAASLAKTHLGIDTSQLAADHISVAQQAGGAVDAERAQQRAMSLDFDDEVRMRLLEQRLYRGSRAGNAESQAEAFDVRDPRRSLFALEVAWLGVVHVDGTSLLGEREPEHIVVVVAGGEHRDATLARQQLGDAA